MQKWVCVWCQAPHIWSDFDISTIAITTAALDICKWKTQVKSYYLGFKLQCIIKYVWI